MPDGIDRLGSGAGLDAFTGHSHEMPEIQMPTPQYAPGTHHLGGLTSMADRTPSPMASHTPMRMNAQLPQRGPESPGGFMSAGGMTHMAGQMMSHMPGPLGMAGKLMNYGGAAAMYGQNYLPQLTESFGNDVKMGLTQHEAQEQIEMIQAGAAASQQMKFASTIASMGNKGADYLDQAAKGN
ncbi:hypothetical protein [Paraburkholderia sp. 2C]